MLQMSGVGRLGKNPEMRYTPAGTAVTNFSVAVETGFGDNKTTAWVRVTTFGKLAEIANQYLQKGSQIYFIGEYQPDKQTGNPRLYQRQDETYASTLECKATHIEFLSGTVKQDESPEAEPEEF